MCNFLRIAVTFDRRAPLGENRLMFLRYCVGQTRPYWAWADAVDGDALRAEINGERMRQTDHPSLGDYIGTITRVAPSPSVEAMLTIRAASDLRRCGSAARTSRCCAVSIPLIARSQTSS